MDASIALRKIAAPTMNFFRLSNSIGHDLDSRVKCHTVAGYTCKFETHPVASLNPRVLEERWRSINVFNDQIQIAGVEDIAYSKSSGNSSFRQRGSRQTARITEATVTLVQLQECGLLVACSRSERIHLRIHVSCYLDQVQPPVVIEVGKGYTPLHQRQRR